MGKAPWDFVALNWEVFVSAVSQHLHHSCIVLFDNLLCLLSKMNLSHPPIKKLLLDLTLVLLEGHVRKLDHIQSMMFLWNLVPNECETVLAKTSNFIYHKVKLFLGTL